MKKVVSPLIVVLLAASFLAVVTYLDPIKAEQAYWIGAKMYGGSLTGQMLSWMSARLAMAKDVDPITLYRSRTAVICVCIVAACLGG